MPLEARKANRRIQFVALRLSVFLAARANQIDTERF
jgi:hypothetical protein